MSLHKLSHTRPVQPLCVGKREEEMGEIKNPFLIPLFAAAFVLEQ